MRYEKATAEIIQLNQNIFMTSSGNAGNAPGGATCEGYDSVSGWCRRVSFTNKYGYEKILEPGHWVTASYEEPWGGHWI